MAARLRRAGEPVVAVVDPATTHYYQPLWTLVGGGCSTVAKSARLQADVMPKSVTWLQQAAASIDPHSRSVSLGDGGTLTYDFLVVCPGIQLDWHKVPGLSETLGKDGVSSNYLPEFAPTAWNFIRGMKRGTAVFGMPSGPINCAGAPQKIAYVAADHWRQQSVLDDIRVVLVLPTPSMFGVPFRPSRPVLSGSASPRRGRQHPQQQGGSGDPQAGARRRGEPARSDGRQGLDRLLRRVRLVSAHDGAQEDAVAEFDYTMQPTPSIPLIDTTQERRDMWLLKKYRLPALYRNLILKGRA